MHEKLYKLKEQVGEVFARTHGGHAQTFTGCIETTARTFAGEHIWSFKREPACIIRQSSCTLPWVLRIVWWGVTLLNRMLLWSAGLLTWGASQYRCCIPYLIDGCTGTRPWACLCSFFRCRQFFLVSVGPQKVYSLEISGARLHVMRTPATDWRLFR